jgi:DnaJ-class molecular chaperone
MGLPMLEVALSAIQEQRVFARSEACPRCGGKGVVADEADWCGIEEGGSIQCPTCRGTGSVPRPKGASP